MCGVDFLIVFFRGKIKWDFADMLIRGILYVCFRVYVIGFYQRGGLSVVRNGDKLMGV